MIDVLDSEAMLGRLGAVERGSEKGALVPQAARELLNDVPDALADSGPFELDVDASAWLSGVHAAQRGLAAAEPVRVRASGARHRLPRASA